MARSENKFDYKSLYSLHREENKKKSGESGKKTEDPKKVRVYNTYQKAFISDRTRILYCPAFRRLQQKAQVFSMETNSNVRSRLTHSLEVSDLGRRLADSITFELRERTGKDEENPGKRRNVPGFKSEEFPLVAAIVENACLIHDIGNPPFGHFGESAIQDWARHEAIQAAPAGLLDRDEDGNPVWGGDLGKWMKDFEEFDGNPQGFRTVTKLFGDHGLNLTCATLLCGLKYARTTCDPKGTGVKKKAGYFQSEEKLVQRLLREMDRAPGTRYPLTYIMEAADDIAYCMSDMADGIEKRLMTEEEFVRVFAKNWKKLWGKSPMPKEIRKFYANGRPTRKEMTDFNLDFSIDWSVAATREAVAAYVDHHDEIYDGTYPHPLLTEEHPMGKVLKTIQAVCEEKLYPSIQAESIELTGYAVITGILRRYKRLLELDYDQFQRLVDGDSKGMAVELRLYHRFADGCVNAYKLGLAEYRDDPQLKAREWWLRVHLLIDHISSMTDAFALETYQMLEGIALMRT